MKLNELRDTSFEIAKSKGWHDPDFDTVTFEDRVALIISELVEALEDYRLSKPACQIEYIKEGCLPIFYKGDAESLLKVSADQMHTAMSLVNSGYKPNGVIVELADAAIRIGDTSGRHNLMLTPESEIRELFKSYENDPPSFGGWFCGICRELVLATEERTRAAEHLCCSVDKICRMAHWLGISGEEFERTIEIKHAYNRTRSHRHGGKKL